MVAFCARKRVLVIGRSDAERLGIAARVLLFGLKIIDTFYLTFNLVQLSFIALIGTTLLEDFVYVIFSSYQQLKITHYNKWKGWV